MTEKIKTALLIVLVAASLVQSYMLAYSSPKFDAIIPTDYVESELAGSQSELKNLLFPKDIVIHFGADRHTILYPDMTFYRMILDVVKQRTFAGIRQSSELAEVSVQGPREAPGLEIRFPAPISFLLLQQIMQLKGDDLANADAIERIWIFTRADRDEVRVFFINGDGSKTYEATKADLTIKDVERFVGFGSSRTPYQVRGGKLYLPEEPVQMVRYEVEYRKFTAEQLQRSLFPDPYNTRILSESNDSEIYTDGKRGLQISAADQWMSFTDPAAPGEGRTNDLDTALSAVQFINRHGGWNGSYMADNMKQESTVNNEETILFRQYAGSYPGAFPIISTEDEMPFGTIRVTLQNGVVTAYKRSLIQLEEGIANRKMAELPGGEELWKLLSSYDKYAMVRDCVPAYRLILLKDNARAVLEPVWSVELSDGTWETLPAPEKGAKS
jgi:regulatory protein YycH of two-component signal transduction system YycFG